MTKRGGVALMVGVQAAIAEAVTAARAALDREGRKG